MTEVAAVTNRFAIDFDDHVPGAKASFVGATALFYGTNQNSLAILGAEKIAELGRKILDHQATARRGMNDHDSSWQIHLRQIWHRRHDWHIEFEFLCIRTEVVR